MKRKSMRIREVMAAEKRFGRRWLREAQANLQMAEDNLREVRKYLSGREAPTSEELALMHESVQLVRDARERVRFYDGVLSGMMIMERAIDERCAVDERPPSAE